MIILKKFTSHLSDMTDLSDLLTVKNPKRTTMKEFSSLYVLSQDEISKTIHTLHKRN